MDPTKVPIAGLSILERVERAKRMKEERQKEAETGSSTTAAATDTQGMNGTRMRGGNGLDLW